jgi:hypothetical protein
MVHIQVGIAGESTWGKNALSMRNLTLFRWHWRRPLVVTLHDVSAASSAVPRGPYSAGRPARSTTMSGGPSGSSSDRLEGAQQLSAARLPTSGNRITSGDA